MVRIKVVLDILTLIISLLGAVPLFLHLDWLPRLIFPLAVAGAVLGGAGSLRLLRGFAPTVISGLFFAYYAFQISRDNLVEPAVNLLVIFLSVRLVSERIPRNYLQVFALSLFALAASTLFSLSPLFLVYLILLLLCIAVSLVLLTFFTSDRRLSLSRKGLRCVVSVAAAMPATSLPLIVVFFFTIPRAQFPLWDFSSPSGVRVTGLSDRVEPGASAQVREVRTTAFRAQSVELPGNDLYWRGIVLNTVKGAGWIRTVPEDTDALPVKGARLVTQTIFPEPTGSQYLVSLDVPRDIYGVRFRQSPDMVFIRRASGSGRIRYDTVSALTDTVDIRREINRRFYLKLPDRLSGRIDTLGRRIAEQGKTDRERLSLLEDYYHSARFRYATSGLPRSSDPIDEFLFERKAGHCEFFASSFALLLRVAGVPSRLVGGYYGGEYNKMGGYYLVTEDMAHVWVEVFLQGQGWVRRDPSVFAVNFAREVTPRRVGSMARLRMLSDSLSYFWNQTIVTFDLDKQLKMVRSTDTYLRNFSLHLSSGRLLSLLSGAGLIAALAWCFLFRKRKWTTREERFIRELYRRVALRYPSLSVSRSLGLIELAEQTGDPRIRRFAELYCGSVYRDRRLSDKDFACLKDLLKGI